MLSTILAESNRATYKPAYFIFFVSLALLAGLRGDVGQDTFSYMNIYNREMVSLDTLKIILKRQEPFPNILMFVHKQLIDNYTNLLFIVAVIQTMLLAYGTRKMFHRSLFLIFYLIIFYLQYQLSAMRAGFAILFMLAAFSDIEKAPKKALAFAVFGILSHISVIILLPLLLLKREVSFIKILKLICLLTLVAVFVFIKFESIILIKISRYDLLDFSQFRVPKLSTLLIIMLLVSVLVARKASYALLASVFVYSLFLFLSGTFEIAYRLHSIALFGLMFLCFDEKVIGTNFKLRFYFIGVLASLLWLSYTHTQYMFIEHDKWKSYKQTNRDFAYTPYNLYFQSQYR